VSELLALASAIAREAGALARNRFHEPRTIRTKSSEIDLVTDVDHAIDALVRERIRAARPHDAMLTEEGGEVEGTSGVRWIVDPLDGTVNYANGIPFFCVSIAMVDGGRPAVGVVHDPTRHETFAATSGGPATLEGRTIGTSDKERLSDFVVSMALNGRAVATRNRNVRKAIRIPRSMGSAALALSYVANGRFDAFIQQGGLSTWDIAAAGLIAERAGARVTSMTGAPWFDVAHSPASIGILAAPPVHHATLLDLVR
jgi:myo-inositol-1(or 4)-monophosphatase